MSTQPTRPVSVLIAALGGEGGGVLTNWLVDAAQASGFPVQATSIPGVAQRTGATTYYVEIWPRPASELNGRRPVMALAPAPGEVDVVVATELLEAGRTIANGYVTPDRTHLIASTHRVYTNREKMGAEDGRHDGDAIRKAVVNRSQSRLLADMGALAADAGAVINAVMLGALAGSGKLPMGEDALRDAVTAGGIAVDANLKGFQAGLDAANGVLPPEAMDAATLDADTVIAEGVRRLKAFQDQAYGELYRQRLAPFQDGDPALLAAVARNLAVRMAYDDIIRVAGAKLRHVRAQAPQGGPAGGKSKDGIVHTTQYFKPGLREVADIMPAALGRRLHRLADGNAAWAKKQWPMTVRTDTVFGYLRLKVLAGLKPWRRKTCRYQAEQQAIDAWLDEVRRAAAVDTALAIEAADMARLIKGYGKTHRRGMHRYEQVRERALLPALDGQVPANTAAARVREEHARALESAG
jgi:indolepyruvate ferredoxin oxidoreductase beta subunit